MAPAATQTMQKEAFFASPEFKRLTVGQQKFVTVLIDTGDEKLAVKTYKTSSEQYSQMLRRKLMGSPNVIAALDLFYQRSRREIFLRDLENTIRRAKGVAKIQAIALLAKTQGFIPSTGVDETDADAVEGSEHQRVTIGAIVRDLSSGRKFRVTAVNSEGVATDGDPL